jgi:DNA-binding GntR family transcriptional regulator
MENKPSQSTNTETNKAYQEMLGLILDGKLKLGEKISRRKMAELVNTSVIPVTEALHKLENDGLVMTIARSRTVITLPTISEMMGKYMLREVFECKMAHILCENGLSKAQENVLRDLAADLDSCSKNGEKPNPQTHRLFHYTMAEYTGYQCFVSAFNGICLYFLVCQAMSSRRRNASVPEDLHSRIIDAIVGGDCDTAERVMREHVYDSYEYVMRDIALRHQRQGLK